MWELTTEDIINILKMYWASSARVGSNMVAHFRRGDNVVIEKSITREENINNIIDAEN